MDRTRRGLSRGHMFPSLPASPDAASVRVPTPDWSLAGTLAQLAPRLPAELVSHEGLARALRVAHGLPARLSRCIYLETWPKDTGNRVDMIVQLDPSGRDLLIQPGHDALARALAADPAWQPVLALARRWQAPGGLLEQLVAGAWLEFDVDPGAAATPVTPRVFVDFRRDALAGLDVADVEALVHQSLEPLRGQPLDAASARQLRACLEALPPAATLPYVGAFDVEGKPALRLCVRGLGSELKQYLRRVSWPGDGAALEAQVLAPLARARGDGAVSLLHLDLVPEVAARIGLEYAFARRCQLRGRVAERGLLDHLVERGWCAPAQRDAVLAWPGQGVELLPHEIWHSRVARRVNHVKLTYASGGALGLKIYLCVYHELWADGTLLGTRPRFFGTLVTPRPVPTTPLAPAPTIGAGAPTAAPQEAAKPRAAPTSSRARLGMLLALCGWKGGLAMTMTTKEHQVLEAVLQRSVVDYEFRQELLTNPRRAIQEALGVSIPANFRVKFIEKDKNVDALVVLPNYQHQNGELSDDDLEEVAGGGGGTSTDPDWAQVP